MSTARGKGAKRAESTRELIRAKALVRGEMRSSDTRGRVEAAMAAIEQEMTANDGIYPHNNGALSGAEVARRAGVHPTTLFSPKQRTLGGEVKDWLEALKKRKTVGAGPVRRALADRIADWRQMYEGLAQSHRDTELLLQQTQVDLESTAKQLEQVLLERDALREQLAKRGPSTVVALPPKRR
jgi:hypothetical protein